MATARPAIATRAEDLDPNAGLALEGLVDGDGTGSVATGGRLAEVGTTDGSGTTPPEEVGEGPSVGMPVPPGGDTTGGSGAPVGFSISSVVTAKGAVVGPGAAITAADKMAKTKAAKMKRAEDRDLMLNGVVVVAEVVVVVGLVLLQKK
jgi:hypothetical protein